MSSRTHCLLYIVLLFVLAISVAHAQDCKDVLLLDANERVRTVGLDTSGRWWAISQPFDNLMGLIVDRRPYGPYDAVITPKFAYDGSTFVAGVKWQGRWSVRTETDSVDLMGDTLYDTYLPTRSATPWWFHANGDDRKLSTFDRSYRCVAIPQGVCFDPQGMVVAWTETRGPNTILLVNGAERVTGDEILLGGVFADGEPVFAVRFGTRWSIFKGRTELATALASVGGLAVNALGNACGWVASDGAGVQSLACFGAEMAEPWTSLPTQSAQGLIISPFDPLVAARTFRNGNSTVSYQGAEYPSGRTTGPLSFSHDGALLVYAGIDGDHFVTINGKRHWVRGAVDLRAPLVVNTSGTAVAWASATTLVYVNLDLNVLRLGKMVDRMGPVIYDRRTGTFKGLGFVTGRLYLLECDPR